MQSFPLPPPPNTGKVEPPVEKVVRATAILSIAALIALSIVSALIIILAGALLKSVFPELHEILLDGNGSFLGLVLTQKFIFMYVACAVCGTAVNFAILFLLRLWDEFRMWGPFGQAAVALAISWFIGGYGVPFFFQGILS